MALLQPRDFVLDDVSPTLPDTATVPHMSSIRIAWMNQLSAPVVSLQSVADHVVAFTNGQSVAFPAGVGFTFQDQYQVLELVSDQVGKRWMVQSFTPADIAEHQFDITTPQTANGDAVTLTFDPLITGQVNELLSLSADNNGTRLTATQKFAADVTMSLIMELTIGGNNGDVNVHFDSVDTNIQTGFVPPIAMAFSHSRAGVFTQTAEMSGVVAMDVGDWLRFDFDEIFASAGSSGIITAGVIRFIGPVILA